jgi:hypothetical protein
MIIIIYNVLLTPKALCSRKYAWNYRKAAKKDIGGGLFSRRLKVEHQPANAYLNHPILGPRLRHCTRLITLVEGRSIDQIFGDPDDLKFHSAMTLFANATSDNQVFRDALHKYFGGELDRLTLERL